MLVAEFQRLAKLPGPLFGKRAGFIDAEHSLDPIHVRNLGVDVSPETGMLVNQPDSGEQAFDIMEAMCYSNQFGLVIVDSAAALVPLAELEHGMDYNPIGLQARLLSQGLRKLKGLAYKHNVTFVFINQLREKPGMGGPIEVTPGGRALRFYSSMRLDVRAKKIEKSGAFLGQATTVKFVKNKVAVPFTVAEYDYYWIGGVDRIKNIMDVAIETGVIKRAGAYYFYGEDSKNPYRDGQGNELKWQGKENLLEALRNSPALYEYTNNIVLGKIPKDAQFVAEQEDNPEEENELALDL
jgi:recombination protein RecA